MVALRNEPISQAEKFVKKQQIDRTREGCEQGCDHFYYGDSSRLILEQCVEFPRSSRASRPAVFYTWPLMGSFFISTEFQTTAIDAIEYVHR